MRSFHEGQLVTVLGESGELEGIVVHAPSLVKIEVAVPEAAGEPVFRTVHPKRLKERSAAGENDDALRRLIRRTASAGRAGTRAGPGSRRGRRGHSQPSGHRTTGK
jgi:ribosomal protein L4